MQQQKKTRTSLTPEGREAQLISLAMDQAEEQLRNGTASSQVITHFLKLGTENAALEREKLRADNLLAQTKIESIKSEQRSKEMFEEAIRAFKGYSGQTDFDEEYDEDNIYD